MLKFHARLLGYIGLMPFIMLPFLMLWETVSYFEGISFFIQYSAIILSFLGGVLWFDGIHNNRTPLFLYLSMIPLLTAWLGVIWLPPLLSLIILAVAFIVLIVYEFTLSSLAIWYRSLRIRLTAITIGCHLMIIWLIYSTN